MKGTCAQKTIECADARGIFIRADETEEAYLQRILALQVVAHSADPSLIELYGFSPDWIPVVYSNDDIRFWEAGISWIDESSDPPRIGIQLRQHFESNRFLYGVYSKEEVLEHEYVHAARFLFEASVYDEHFCYYTSFGRGALSCIRAVLGPLFQERYEVLVVLLLLLIPLFCMVFGCDTLLGILPCVSFMVYLSLRLTWRWKRWLFCRKHLRALVAKEMQLMVRLRDCEIDLFSSLSVSDIYEWVQRQDCFRWRFLRQRYF